MYDHVAAAVLGAVVAVWLLAAIILVAVNGDDDSKGAGQ